MKKVAEKTHNTCSLCLRYKVRTETKSSNCQVILAGKSSTKIRFKLGVTSQEEAGDPPSSFKESAQWQTHPYMQNKVLTNTMTCSGVVFSSELQKPKGKGCGGTEHCTLHSYSIFIMLFHKGLRIH